MSSDLKNLYQELILQHNKQPVCFYEMEDADLVLEAYNPICGDRFKVFVKMEADQVSEISFKGYGCAISKASTSVMMEQFIGKTKSELEGIIEEFYQAIEGTDASNSREAFQAFAKVKDFPGRKQCVVLAWVEWKHHLENPPS